jgi:hypothetical protein
MLLAGTPHRCAHNARNIIRLTNIYCPGSQGLGPHFFVGYTMSADNTDPGEILRQMLDLGKWSSLNIQNGNLSAVLDDAIPQLTQRLDLLYRREILRQRGCQRLRNSGVALEENNFERFHISLCFF